MTKTATTRLSSTATTANAKTGSTYRTLDFSIFDSTAISQGEATKIHLNKRPERVAVVLDRERLAASGNLFVHHQTVFLEDSGHDWFWSQDEHGDGGTLRYLGTLSQPDDSEAGSRLALIVSYAGLKTDPSEKELRAAFGKPNFDSETGLPLNSVPA